jgi:hypothetical protein
MSCFERDHGSAASPDDAAEVNLPAAPSRGATRLVPSSSPAYRLRSRLTAFLAAAP